MIDIDNMYTRTVGDEMIEMDIEFEDLQVFSVTENPSHSMESLYHEEKPKHHTDVLVKTSPLVEEHTSETIDLYYDFMFDLVSYCYQTNEDIELEDLQHYIGYFVPNITTIQQNPTDGAFTHNQDIENIISEYQEKDRFVNIFLLVAFSGVRALITILNAEIRDVNTDRFRVDTDDDGNLKTPNVNGETESDAFQTEFEFTLNNYTSSVNSFTEDIPVVFERHYRYSEYISRMMTGLVYSPVTTLDEAIGVCEHYLQVPITGNAQSTPSQLQTVCNSFPDIYTSIFCYYIRLYRFAQE